MYESGKLFLFLGKAQYMTKNLLVINTSYLVKGPCASSDGVNVPMVHWYTSQKHISHSSILLLPALRPCLQWAGNRLGERGRGMQHNHTDTGPHLELCFLLVLHGGCCAARAFWG